jgi:hypothetical protein
MNMRRFTFGIVCVCAVLSISSLAGAGDYYVSPSGSDSNPGTIGSPWATPLKAWTDANAGDTVYFRAGSYAVNTQIWTKYFGNDGTADNPIVFKNYPSESVTFTSTLTGQVFIIEKSYNYVEGINFVGASTWFFVAYDTAANHFKASHCTATLTYGGDNTGFVALGAGAAGTIVEHCKIVGPGTGGNIHLNTAGLIIFRAIGLKLIHNEISNTQIGIYFKHANPQANPTPDIEIAYNYIHDTGRNSIQTNSNHAYIHDNVFGNNNAGFLVADSNGGVGGDYNTIEHNTFYNSSLTLSYQTATGDTVPGTIGNTLTNNVFRTTTYVHEYSATAHQTISNYNLYPTGVAYRENVIDYTLAAWKVRYPTMDANSITGAAIYVGGTSPTILADFALSSTSPGRNAASDGKDMGADISQVGPQTIPTAVNDSYSMYSNRSLTVPAGTGVLANDAGSGTVTASKISDPSHGSVTLNADGGFIYTPANGYTGSDSFTYQAHNTIGDSNTATVTITITTQPAIAVTSPNGSEVWAIGSTATVVWTSAGSVGNVDIELSTEGGATWTTLAADIANDGSEAVTVPNTYSKSCLVRVKQSAGGIPSDVSDAAFTITVLGDATLDGYVDGGDLNILLSHWNATNATWATGDLTGDGYVDGGDLNVLLSHWNVRVAILPIANNDSYSLFSNHTLTVAAASGLLLNDTGIGTLTAVKVTDPSHGNLSLSADGGFVYTPTTGYVGGDSFTYVAHNTNGDSNVATVSLTVNTTPPPTVADDTYSTLLTVGGTMTVPAAGVLANDIDAAGLSMTASKVSDPLHGSLTLNADGSFVYTPASGFTGSDSFTYKAYNGVAYSNTATVNITATQPATRVLVDVNNTFLCSTTLPNSDGKYWNNFSSGTITSCTTSTGGLSGIQLTRATSFNSSGNTAYTSPINSWPVNAVKDFLFMNNSSATGTMEFSKLDTTGSKTYELTVFGSATDAGITLYTVVGSATASQQVNTGYNQTKWSTFSGLKPDASGKITLKVNLIGSGRAPLNVMDLAVFNTGGVTGASAPAEATVATQGAALALNVNFQPASVVGPQGYVVDSGLPYGKASNGYTYGWTTDMSSYATQRNSAASPDVRYDTAIMLVSGGTWEMSVPNGMYDVKIVAGDGGSLATQKFSVEGVPTTQASDTAGWYEESVTVVVTDGKLTIAGGAGSSICFVQITGR